MKKCRLLFVSVFCSLVLATSGCGGPQGSDSTEDIDQDKASSKDSTRYPGRNSDAMSNDDTSNARGNMEHSDIDTMAQH